MSPAISVLVPTFNDGALLEPALRSLQIQSFPDFEVIVSDDAGTDGSVEAMRLAFAQDHRFRFVRQPRNLGMTQNWNAALALATGAGVMKLDGDDALHPQTLERLSDAAHRYQADMAFCRTEYCDAALQPMGEYKGEQWMRANGIDPGLERAERGSWWYRFCFDDRQLWHSNAFLVARTLLDGCGGWDARWGCASDSDLILRLLETDGTVVHCPYVGVRYRLRDGSVSDRFRRNAWLPKEVSAIHLLSLQRQYGRGVRLDSRLRQNWYRHWVNWCGTAPPREVPPGGLPPVFSLSPPSPPPLSVRVTGALRGRASTLRRAFMRRSSQPPGQGN